jgi:hypothetical protein
VDGQTRKPHSKSSALLELKTFICLKVDARSMCLPAVEFCDPNAKDEAQAFEATAEPVTEVRRDILKRVTAGLRRQLQCARPAPGPAPTAPEPAAAPERPPVPSALETITNKPEAKRLRKAATPDPEQDASVIDLCGSE